MLGTTLVNRYKITRELSHGGFGQTFIAEDLHLPGHPKCAIKQLKPMDTRPVVLEAAKKLFDREAETLYKLGKHDQIPSLLAHFEEGAEFYLAQEFIEGKVLSDEILPGQPLSQPYVVQLMQDILHILDFVHKQGVIHRDIKPANLIRRFSDNRLVLIDFGAVKEASLQRLDPQGHTSSTMAVGTYGYMPDEQANGRPKFASDIYAVGMLGIQALTGVLPNQLPEDFATGEVVWRNMVPSLSPELAEVLDKMARSHFTQRYQSASEAIEALQKVPEPVAAMAGVAPTVLPAQFNPPSIAPPPAIQPFVSPVVPATETSKPTEVPQVGLPIQTPALETAVQPGAIANPTTPQNGLPQTTTPQSNNPPGIPISTTPHKQNSGIKLNKQLVWIGVGSIAAAGAIASYFVVQGEGDKRLLARLEEARTSKAAGNYSQCIERVKSIPSGSRYEGEAKALGEECQTAQINSQAKTILAEAQQLAKDNKLEAAIAAANKIPSTSSSYPEVQKSIAQWSESLLKIATRQFEQGKLKEAIALTRSIPPGSPTGKKAQQLVTQWQAQWNADEAAFKAADKAVKEGKWRDAIASSQKVKTAFWKKQTDPIVAKANAALTPAPAPAPEPVQATQPVQTRETYVEPAPVYEAPAPVRPAPPPEPAYVPPPPAREPSLDSLPAPSKGN
ncbi:serine/threonine-protein kinase [Pseudanabaena sp. PCC 6802]|uniref:serine/threonine-protein kinase n=1 Tax=Pseudanabaena sp. PCC 6802 TaxID=118173 RepID=UPI00034A4560|nr:serine/threonine-protein kinase [Pseudanabaena sp. PCC 6802]